MIVSNGGSIASFMRRVLHSSRFISSGWESFKSRAIVDRVRLQVTGGNGGPGAIAYIKHTRHKNVGPGWPCGGRGGRGAHVFVQASYNVPDLNGTLPFIRGKDGTSGGKDVPGENGPDEIIHVPVGSVVWKLSVTDEDEETERIRKICLADLAENNQKVMVAVGGSGGKGNNPQRPHDADNGSAGETVRLEIELKTLADVGFVGFPNAGKSTLLNAISRATPKIAPYPFTTLRPYCGEVYYSDDVRLTVADLPGLVEGAHLNRGLGFQFLRHAERTAVLAFVLDCSPDADVDSLGNADPVEALETLRYEVTKYSEEMAKKPWLVIANKCDKDVASTLQRVDKVYQYLKDKGIPVYAISAKHGDGIPRFLTGLRKLTEKARAEAVPVPLRPPPDELVKRKKRQQSEQQLRKLQNRSTFSGEEEVGEGESEEEKIPKWMFEGEGKEMDLQHFQMNSSNSNSKRTEKPKKIKSPFIVHLK